MPSITKKSGRPSGSRTKANIVGKKRARRFFDLIYDDGKRPTAAAKIVADEFGTTPEDVFKAKKRHEPALAVEVLNEAKELERQIAERRAAMEMGPHALGGIASMLHILRESLKGNTA